MFWVLCVAGAQEEQQLNATRVEESKVFRSTRSALPVFQDVVTLSALNMSLSRELHLLRVELASHAERQAAQRLYVPWRLRVTDNSDYRQMKLTYLPRVERAIAHWIAVELLLQESLTSMSDIVGKLLIQFNKQQADYENDVCLQLNHLVELLAQRIGQLHRQMEELKIRIHKARKQIEKHTINVRPPHSHSEQRCVARRRPHA